MMWRNIEHHIAQKAIPRKASSTVTSGSAMRLQPPLPVLLASLLLLLSEAGGGGDGSSPSLLCALILARVVGVVDTSCSSPLSAACWSSS